MEKKKAHELLKRFAAWRRGSDEFDLDGQSLMIGLAIDEGIAALERELFAPSKAEKPEIIRDPKAKCKHCVGVGEVESINRDGPIKNQCAYCRGSGFEAKKGKRK